MQRATMACRATLQPSTPTRATPVTRVVKALPKVGGLASVLLSSAGKAVAEEFELPAVSIPEIPDIPIPSDLASLFADNPLLVGGGIALLLVPVGINLLLGAGGEGAKIKVTTAARALEALEQNPKVILVDIRSKADIKATGQPDLSSIKRKAVLLPYTQVVKGEEVVDEAFGDKFAKLAGLGEEARVLLLDAAGTKAPEAAKVALATEAISSVYVIQGGAEGPKGWKESGLPWKEPGKGLEFPAIDLSLLDPTKLAATVASLAEELQSAPTLTKAGLAAAGLGAAGFLLFNEIEVVLQVLGLVAAGQFALKLLFAEEREQTLTEIRTLVNDKIAVTEAGEDLKKLATVLLEDTSAAAASTAPEAKPAAAEPAPAPAAAAKAESNGATPAGDAVPENVKEAREWIEAYKARSAASK